jgi:eukaryotic-like serine/threonine-protein kinase
MVFRMVCLHGHEWDGTAHAAGSAAGPPASCPRCGAPSELAPTLPLPGAVPPPAGQPTEPDIPGNSAVTLDSERELPGGSADTLDQSATTPGPGGFGFTSVRAEIPGYDILRVLGRGGMGVVYAARHRALGRVVALKMILAGAHAGPAERDRFVGEAEALARLQHPNIVQIHEIGTHDDCPYLSLEYVAGQSLADALLGTPMPARRAAELLETIARAIAVAHERGILHRDLKPANILFTPEGVPKITDFGLAKRLDREVGQTRTGSILGTPSYMAPEQARGQAKHIGAAADIYALGAILYECLTGRPPFRSESPVETLRQVVDAEPVAPRLLNPKVDRDLETIALKCLQKEPAQRFATAKELADDLGRYIRGEPIRARQVGAAERVWRWSTRNPRMAALAVFAATLLLLLTAGSVVATLVIARERDRAVVARRAADGNAEAARTAQRLSERNAKIAGEQADLAIDALKAMVGDVQKRLGNKPESAALRNDLLEAALERLNRVLRTGERAGLSGRVMASAAVQIGDIELQLGRLTEGVRRYRDALAIATGLAAAEPNSDLARGNLALIHSKLAAANAQAGDWPGAREQYERAIALQTDLVNNPRKGDVPHSEMILNLAGFRDAFGRQLLERGDPTNARAQLEDALRWREQLAAASAEDVGAKRAVADLCQRLADLSFSAGDREEMQRYFARSFALREDLAGRQPANRQLQFELANTGAGYGDKLLFLGANREALGYYQPALDQTDTIAGEEPRNEPLQGVLAMALYRAATAQLRLGESESARALYQRALAIRQRLAETAPGNPDRRINLMIAQARCGLCRVAAENAEQLRQEGPKNPKFLFQIACCYALCVPGVSGSSSARDNTGAGNRDLESRDFGADALAALRLAVDAGYQDFSSIEHDPDLDPIRDRADFRQFLESLKSSAKTMRRERP